MDIKYRIGRAYDATTWNCAHCVADYFEQREGVDVSPAEPGGEWDKAFLYWMRNYFTSRGPLKGDWMDHIGELVTCKPVGGRLHVGVVTPQGVYHAYRGLRTAGGDTVITAFELFNYRDVRFFSWKTHETLDHRRAS